MSNVLNPDSLLSNEELLLRLEEAEETLRAIRSGEVDALVVSGAKGDQVFTLKDATLPYQILIEEMNEGALTLSPEGVILYCNARFAEMLSMPIPGILGQSFLHFVMPGDQTRARGFLEHRLAGKSRGELTLLGGRLEIPVGISMKEVMLGGEMRLCVVITDLTEHKHAEAELRKAHDELELRVQERTEELSRANSELEEKIIERKQTEAALQAANRELKHFNNMMVGRELRMIELKKEVNQLCERANLPLRYGIIFEKK